MSDKPLPLHQKIRRARLARHLSQPALARALGVSAMTVSRWESGAHRMRIANLHRLSAYFGLPLEHWQDDPGSGPARRIDAEARLRRKARALVSYFRRRLMGYVTAEHISYPDRRLMVEQALPSLFVMAFRSGEATAMLEQQLGPREGQWRTARAPSTPPPPRRANGQ